MSTGNDETLKMILEMFKSISNQIAISNRLTIEFIEELKRYRAEREKKEETAPQDTAAKIETALKKNFEWWYYFRERVMPALLIAAIIAILNKLGLL